MLASKSLRSHRGQDEKSIVEQAYNVPLYAGYLCGAKSKRVKGLEMGYLTNSVSLFDAYIEQ